MLAKLENKISQLSSYLVALMIALVPFYAFLTVWISSNLGYYTWLRLSTEVILVIVVLGAAALLALDKNLARRLFSKKWFWLIAAFFILEIILGLIALWQGNVGLKALGYAWVVDSRYLLFLLAVYIIASKNSFLASSWRRLIFIPASVVVAFAILQFFVLPLDFLKHFGYGANTIFPYETINHNKNYERVMSFTRGANPLGAYLLVVITLLVGWITITARNKYFKLAGLALGLVALGLTFSRSAWLGVVVSLVVLAFLVLQKARSRQIFVATSLVAICVLALVFLGLENNPRFQNYFLHTQSNSLVKTNSNAGHLSALRIGLDDFAHNPLGKGPGTSGPASVYNNKLADRNTENYYLMIGEEDGWVGLAILLAIFALVAVDLYRKKTKLSISLLAGFIGLGVVNLLLPAWTDVTLAYIFWGLTGLSLTNKFSLA